MREAHLNGGGIIEMPQSEGRGCCGSSDIEVENSKLQNYFLADS